MSVMDKKTRAMYMCILCLRPHLCVPSQKFKITNRGGIRINHWKQRKKHRLARMNNEFLLTLAVMTTKSHGVNLRFSLLGTTKTKCTVVFLFEYYRQFRQGYLRHPSSQEKSFDWQGEAKRSHKSRGGPKVAVSCDKLAFFWFLKSLL